MLLSENCLMEEFTQQDVKKCCKNIHKQTDEKIFGRGASAV